MRFLPPEEFHAMASICPAIFGCFLLPFGRLVVTQTLDREWNRFCPFLGPSLSFRIGPLYLVFVRRSAAQNTVPAILSLLARSFVRSLVRQ